MSTSKKSSQLTLEEENAILRAKLEKLERKEKNIVFKVGAKGGVSVYGLGRFPVTLYEEQWKLLLTEKENLLKFIEENKQSLAQKA